MSTNDDRPTKTDHDELRERLPRFISSNTTPAQPDAVYAPRLFQLLSQAGFDTRAIREVLGELLEDGVVVRKQWEGESHPRFRLPEDDDD